MQIYSFRPILKSEIVNQKSKSNMKKAVFITYNQALTERVAFLLDQLQIKGFTQWPLVNGAGTETGEPRMGSHTWPEMNSATITIVEEEMVPLILKYVKALDEVNKEKEKYDLISHTTYKGKEAWIFVNNNKISFKKDELEMILFSNRLYC